MLNSRIALACCVVAALSAASVRAHADVFNMPEGRTSLQFVTVGDPGNIPFGSFGRVDYFYQMGKFDVTVHQYSQFLNAVAVADPYGLYSASMSTEFPTVGITRTGVSGSYNYAVFGNGNVPAFEITWAQAARFCNWIQNGQPSGPQGPNTTETGAYALNGATTNIALAFIERNPNAQFFIPTENEWYKAAFYKGGGTNADYWRYSTGADAFPGNILPDTGNNANFFDIGTADYTDPVNLLTPVGAFSLTPGPYGTFDMGGNLRQWTETRAGAGVNRILRGNDYSTSFQQFVRSYSINRSPTTAANDVGFRIARVPEPSSAMLAIVLTTFLIHTRQARSQRTKKPRGKTRG